MGSVSDRNRLHRIGEKLMKRIALLFVLLLLCGAGPAQKRLLLEPSWEQLIRQHSPTLWLDGGDVTKITATDTKVSAWASKVGAVSFTQATGENQPSLTRYDNLEARSLYSESLSNGTYYQTDDVTYTASQADPFGGTSAVLFTTSGGSSRHFGGLPQTAYKGSSAAGEFIRWCVYLKDHTTPSNYNAWIGFNDTTYKGIIVAPSTGAIVATGAGVTSSVTTIGGGWFRACATTAIAAAGVINTYIGFTATATTTDGPSVFDDDGEAIVFFGPQLSSSLASSTYLATTTYPQYRGINGRSAVRFDGAASYMNSTAVLSSVITASTAELIAVVRPQYIADSRNIFRDAGAYFNLQSAAGPVWYATNNDGGVDVLNTLSAAADVGMPTLLHLQHTGGVLSYSRNGGAFISAVSGDTADLTNILRLGAANTTPANVWNGSIAEIITFNKVLPSDVRIKIQKGLCKKWGASC